jgi:hypothetical protein
VNRTSYATTQRITQTFLFPFLFPILFYLSTHLPLSFFSMDRAEESSGDPVGTAKEKALSLINSLSDVLTRGKASPLLGKDPTFSESLLNELFVCFESIRREWERHLKNVKTEYEDRIQSLRKDYEDGGSDAEAEGSATKRKKGKDLETLLTKRDQSSVFFSINQERIVEEGTAMLIQHAVVAHLPEALIIPWNERFSKWDACRMYFTSNTQMHTSFPLIFMRGVVFV